MKKVFYLFTIILFCACSEQKEKDSNNEPSLQERAEALAAEYTKSTLYVPDSYDPVETKIDSAFTSAINDIEIYVAASKILEYESEHIYSILSSPTERESKKLQSYVELIKTRAAEKGNEFCGWQIYHRCRAKNKVGEPGFITALYITDKDLSEVTIAYDLSDDNPFEFNFDDYVELIEGVIEGEYDTKYQYDPDSYIGFRNRDWHSSNIFNGQVEAFEKQYDDFYNDLDQYTGQSDSDYDELEESAQNMMHDLMMEAEQWREDYLEDIDFTYDEQYDYDDYTDIDDIDIDLDIYSDLDMLI